MTTAVCPSYSTCLTVDLGAIRANYRAIASHVAPAMCGAVVKADAYGLGAGKVVPALYREGCRIFFVAQLCEALALCCAVGNDSKIVILNGLDPGCEALCADNGFMPVLNSVNQIERWRCLSRDRGAALPAALQLDSGMSRLGVSHEIAATLATDPQFDNGVFLQLIVTHLACADDPDHPANKEQLARFQAAVALFPGVPASISNSGGSFLPRSFHFDVVRPGIALFGAAPGPQAPAFRPVARLAARILQIRNIPAGAGVGYGFEFIANSPRTLATLGIGYADGWPRHLSNVGAAWHGKARLPIVGRVSMDSLTVDISALAEGELQEGDLVELLGPSQSLDDVADQAGTISYEILTRLGARHQRIYLDDPTGSPASGENQ